MTGRRTDDRGQIHTIEGVVSGMIIILAMMYIISSITFVSPQTEKTTVMKLSIKSQDILNVLSTPDQPGNYTNPLARYLAQWQGGEADDLNEVNPGEPSIIELNDKLQSLIPRNVLYNLDLLYVDDTASAAAGHLVFDSKHVIFQGDPHDNSVVASKLIVLNYYDLNSTSGAYWYDTAIDTEVEVPTKTIEVQLALWYM
jgi:hypothetical protein